jgi:hypothetical protein
MFPAAKNFYQSIFEFRGGNLRPLGNTGHATSPFSSTSQISEEGHALALIRSVSLCFVFHANVVNFVCRQFTM